MTSHGTVENHQSMTSIFDCFTSAVCTQQRALVIPSLALPCSTPSVPVATYSGFPSSKKLAPLVCLALNMRSGWFFLVRITFWQLIYLLCRQIPTRKWCCGS